MSSAPIDSGAEDALAAPRERGAWRRRKSRREGIGARIKRFLPRTLEGRTILILVVPVVAAQLITVYIFFERHFSALSVDLARGMAGDIAMIIDESEAGAANRARVFLAAGADLELSVDFEPGAALTPEKTRPWNPLIEPILATALEERVMRPFTIGAYGDDNWVEIRVQLDDGVLDVRSPQHRLFSYTAFVFILWVIAASLILTWVAVIFMRNQVRPIRRLALAAESFGKGRDVVRLRPAGALEVRQAAAAFIVMRDRIRRQIIQRTEMLAGVSHDLRSPLTRMKLQLALFGNEEEIEGLRADVLEMEGMIDAYLAFARGEGGETPVRTDLAALLVDIVGGLPGRGRVTLNIDGEIAIESRPVAMRRCLVNLIGNALRYADAVVVTAASNAKTVSVVIDDNGPGIPTERREEVFRAFVRLDPSRNAETGGVGLGLTIARDIAHGHGGEISLEDSPEGGLRVILTLPR
jgi:two-component system osmolarity sensor histidine kinase EnvZ